MSRVEIMRLGVVVERRKSDHPWQDHAWVPVAVLPGAPESEGWRPIAEGPGWVRYHAGTLALELFPKETEAYLYNLTAAQPAVYVILRRREAGDVSGADGPDVTLFHVTVSGDEVRDYLDSGTDIIEGVPMPPLVRAWIEDYVARYHKDEPFEKRVRKRWRDADLPDRSGGKG
jgi:hypothetical protein